MNRVRSIRMVQVLLTLAITGLFAWSCSTVPITGRKQLNLVPEDQVIAMAASQYDTVLMTHKLSTDKEQTAMIKRCGARIQKAVETYFQSKGQMAQLAGYEWEFNLIESKELNAWCMPGGKVVVYTGILPVTGDENGLAVVRGHEIAHALREHARERIAKTELTRLGASLLSEFVGGGKYSGVFSAGGQLMTLKFSRDDETEADSVGLELAARAGYDPRAGISLWKKMTSANKGAPPQWLSTHPSGKNRIEEIERHLPEVMPIYERTKSQSRQDGVVQR